MSMTQKARTSAPGTILYEGKATSIAAAVSTDDDVWLPLANLTESTGWEVKPEGICKDEMCVMVPDNVMSSIVREDGEETWFNLAGFARFLDRPYAHDATHNAWSFGGLSQDVDFPFGPVFAPDFTLPDLDGNSYSLSSFRGKKVFLACWATW
jgi:hypothetical protein